MTPLTVEDMRRIELEIMDEIHRVCTEHGLRYCLNYGTLLGALRHGGFIPWDDDMDITMFRDEYEVLAAHFNEWCQVERFRLSWYRDGSGACQFMKVVDTTTLVEEAFNRAEFATGVWVDIFPLDHYDEVICAPAKKKMERLGLKRSFILTNPRVASNGGIALAKKLVCPFVQNKDPKPLSQQMDELSRDMCPKATDLLVCAVNNEWQWIFPRDMFVPQEIDFEDRRYMATAEYERLLTYYYGDWRTPPAPDNREMHTAKVYRL